MNQSQNAIYIVLLRKAVEQKAELQPKTPTDFEMLSEIISQSGAGYISVSTLKRLWGYVRGGSNQHVSTLNILADFAGYKKGFADFVSQTDRKKLIESGFGTRKCLDVFSLAPDTTVELSWLPDRRITLKYIGDCVFEVATVENAKITAGSLIRCSRMVDGEMLTVDVLDGEGKTLTLYDIGKQNGIAWQLLPPVSK